MTRERARVGVLIWDKYFTSVQRPISGFGSLGLSFEVARLEGLLNYLTMDINKINSSNDIDDIRFEGLRLR